MKDLASRLRKHAKEVLDPGYPYYGTPEMVREAADEIERLRLTDEERAAIAEAVGAYNDNDDDEECARIAATLHGLLKRTERRS
jgi:hypothetical protein